MRDVHIIYTDLSPIGQGWDVTSPQVPSLAFGAATADAVLAEITDVLDSAGLRPGTYRLHSHEQKFSTSPAGNEFYVRFSLDDPDARDDHLDPRSSVVGRELHAVEDGNVDQNLDRFPTTPTGERIIIAVADGDKVGWILDQLAEGEGASVSSYGGQDMVWTVPIFPDDRHRGTPLSELGITRDSTVRDLMDRVISGEITELSAHTAIALV